MFTGCLQNKGEIERKKDKNLNSFFINLPHLYLQKLLSLIADQ